jgi:hypothetical protein
VTTLAKHTTIKELKDMTSLVCKQEMLNPLILGIKSATCSLAIKWLVLARGRKLRVTAVRAGYNACITRVVHACSGYADIPCLVRARCDH